LEAHDCLLAETHYQLGLANGYSSQCNEAVAQFGKSIEVVEKRIAVLHEQMRRLKEHLLNMRKKLRS
jgi:nuclear autoantigenic sperm protein